MPPHSSADTPVMRQFLEVKERYPDCVVFFRMGDFYEMFFEDATWASQALELTLTSRDKGREDAVPMCGVPHHAARYYIGKAVSLGRKVALCEQVEDPKLARKIVRRAVTQVITPGVLLEEDQLQPKVSNYLAALQPGAGPSQGHAGLALLDVSAGEFSATQGPLPKILEELARREPAEVLLVAAGDDDAAALAAELGRRLRAPLGRCAPCPEDEDQAALREALGEAVAAALEGAAEGQLDGPGEDGPPTLRAWPLARGAAAACVRYARGTQQSGSLPLSALSLSREGDTLLIDAAARDNLELFQTLMERKSKGSLCALIDLTRTAMGGRLLRGWLAAPLCAVAPIRRRHDAVEWILEKHRLRGELREALGAIHDLARLTGRLTMGVASPRDLHSLRTSLEALPRAQALLAEAAHDGEGQLSGGVPALLSLGEDLCADVAAAIAAAITDDPPTAWREGGFIRAGYHAELDELCAIAQGGKDYILRIEEREQKRTGISSLKVRYNRVFGYYLEITRSNLQKAPADYIRKQTLANAERFVTPELQEYEAKVLGAEERVLQLSLELFEALHRSLAKESVRLLKLAERVAQLDVLAALAELAHQHGYVRPHVDDSLRIDIEDGRHPVVERLLDTGQFVPNDTTLDVREGPQLAIITGPNMAGKSTVMRQVALICILAQMGSFVPARRARLGLVDKVFTRVGAADNLARGESTFMVEMRETATIVHSATQRSLVILDEIGRGTSTYDGLSIAWAVAEHLHDAIGCRTLFATHYHELCALAESRPLVTNLSIAVREYQGEIVFLHKLVSGGASRSYGIEVARLAGLPRAVVQRAQEILGALEAGATGSATAPTPAPATNSAGPAAAPARPGHGPVPVSQEQLGLFGGMGQALEEGLSGLPGGRRRRAPQRGGVAEHQPPAPAEHQPPPLPRHDQAVLERLRSLDADGLTPRDALNVVAQLCEQLRSGAA